jgi:hypothetical protein
MIYILLSALNMKRKLSSYYFKSNARGNGLFEDPTYAYW